MSPYFLDPSWFERHWYGNPPPQLAKPPALLGWVALAASLAIAVIVLGGQGA
jgi:hypothetical protein